MKNQTSRKLASKVATSKLAIKRKNQLWEILNVPNTMSLFRIFSVPWFMYFLFSENQVLQWLAVLIFIIASLTDYVDGYWARKFSQETKFGKQLDAAADKILVIGALFTFVSLYAQIELWMVMFIISRDVIITFLRYLAYTQGTYLRTTQFARMKTAFQMLSIILILISFVVLSLKERNRINQIYLDHPDQDTFQIAYENLQIFLSGSSDSGWVFTLATFVPYFLLFLTAMVTIISGLHYLVINKHLFYASTRRSNIRR